MFYTGTTLPLRYFLIQSSCSQISPKLPLYFVFSEQNSQFLVSPIHAIQLARAHDDDLLLEHF